MIELTTEQALGFIADGLCACEGTLEDSHTDGCPQDNEARAWLAQVQREAKIEALREAARELQKDVDRPLGANAHPREVGRRDGLQKSWSLLHARADRMEDEK